MKARPTWPALLLLAAAVSRVLYLSASPGGLNVVEASIGYRAWSLVHYGMDPSSLTSENRLLLAFPSAASPLYVYLSTPFVALGGLSIWTTRLPAAIAGVLSLLLFWKLGKRAEAGMAELSLLLVATSPWHLVASRSANGAHVAPMIVLAGVLLLERAHTRPLYAPLASLLLTTCVLAQSTAALFAVAFFVWALWIVRAASPIPRSPLIAAGLASPLVLLPLSAFAGSRWHGPPSAFSEFQHGGQFLLFRPSGFTGVFANIAKLFEHLLGVTNDSSPWDAAACGPAFVILLPFLVLGLLYSLSHRRSLVDRLVLAWFVCAIGAAACFEATIENMSLIWFPGLWLSARGLWMLREERLLFFAARSTVFAFGVAFAVTYFGLSGRPTSQGSWVGLGAALAEASEKAPRNTPVIVTNHTPMAYLPTLFFEQTPPSRFLSTAVVLAGLDSRPDVVEFDRFRFGVAFQPVSPTEQPYWIVHRSELTSFDIDSVVIKTFGEHALVRRRSEAELRCLLPVDPLRMTGWQDFGVLTANASVSTPSAGFTIGGRHFSRGFGVHGNSTWELTLSDAARELSFGVALSDTAVCSDGMTFSVRADGKTVFTSSKLRMGEIEYHVIPLSGVSKLTFITHALATNACDHGDWLRPIVLTCG